MNSLHTPLRSLLHTLFEHFNAGQHAQALILLMTNIPRLRGNYLLKYYAGVFLELLGHEKMATEIFDLVATHFANSGQPLLSITSAKRLARLQGNPQVHFERIASLYNNASPFLDNIPIPSLLHANVKDPIELKAPSSIDAPVEDLARNLHNMAIRQDHFAHTPDTLPHIPLLSLLDSPNLRSILELLTLTFHAPQSNILDPSLTSLTPLPTWLATGEANLSNSTTPSCTLPPGVAFNYRAILGQPNLDPSVIITAVSPCACLTISGDVLSTLHTNPAILRATANADTAARVDHTLATLPILKSLLSNERHHILQYMEAVRIPKDTLLAQQKATNPGMFILISGKVAITHDTDGFLTHLHPGDVIGEIGLITDGRAVATATTKEDTQALFMSAERYKKFSQSYPSIHEALCEGAAKKLLSN